MKTFNAKTGETNSQWWIVDATDQTVGRLATQIATLIRGKHKPVFTPNMDTGDHVVVINADKVKFSGNKLIEKKYYRHSRFFGSLKENSAEQMLERTPERVITEAVKGMLPKNKLSYKLLKKLRAYAGTQHPHAAQKLQTFTLNNK